MSPKREPLPSPTTSSRVVVKVILLVMIGVPLAAQSQNGAPFEVLNPKKQHWYRVEATRIYTSACDLVARSIRPDKPPHLEPRFRLVLGADDDEFVRAGAINEIRLKSWNPEKFAQGVVVVAVRDVLHPDDLAKIAHQSVVLADSTLDVRELRER